MVGFIISHWAVVQQRESVGIIEQTRFTQEAKVQQTRWGSEVAANTEIVSACTTFFLNPLLGRADFDRW